MTSFIATYRETTHITVLLVPAESEEEATTKLINEGFEEPLKGCLQALQNGKISVVVNMQLLDYNTPEYQITNKKSLNPYQK